VHAETDDSLIKESVLETAQIIGDNGGFVAKDFTVHYSEGNFFSSIRDQIGTPERVLVHYPMHLAVPLSEIEWSDDPQSMEPYSTPTTLDANQLRLLDLWVTMVDHADKLNMIHTVVPDFAIRNSELRAALLNLGFPKFAEVPQPIDAKKTLISWHSFGSRKGEEEKKRLIPLKMFVNHHHSGAKQSLPEPGVHVLTSSTSNSEQTYENYGDLDAMQLLTGFGFVDHDAPVVHSTPLEVESSIGVITVNARSWRYPPHESGRQALTWNQSDDGSVSLRHLAIRPDNRNSTSTYLSMGIQSLAGSTAEVAQKEAERLIDEILQINQNKYSQVTKAVPLEESGTHSAAMVREVCEIQVKNLVQWW
jgi:hypothetical protein